MDKKLFLRRVAILLALVVGVIQMQMGGAVTATAYDFGASYETSDEDLLGSGAFSTAGSATAGTGVVSASASASSSSSNGGSYDFTLGDGIGGTRAQRDSFVRKTFLGLATGTYFATITVDVSSLSTPTSAASPGTLDTVDSNVGRRANVYPKVTNSRAYSFVQLGASGVDSDGPTTSHSSVTATYLSTDGYGNTALSLGSNTLTFSVTLDGPGAVIIEVHLIAEAWAAGNGSTAAAACIADVLSIDLA